MFNKYIRAVLSSKDLRRTHNMYIGKQFRTVSFACEATPLFHLAALFEDTIFREILIYHQIKNSFHNILIKTVGFFDYLAERWRHDGENWRYCPDWREVEAGSN